jgi:3-oxoacyl-[acyl-carrier-protein] synthase-3
MATPMSSSSRFVSHIAYAVGTGKPIEALSEKEALTTETIELLRKNGLDQWREDERTIPEMCLASAAETLRSASLRPADVRTMVLASSNSDAMVSDDDETNLFASLHAAGFERARILGLTLQSCSASGEALTLASDIASSESNDVLVVVFAQRKKMSRLGPQGNLIFSDGAVSCLVSTTPGDYEICATESVTNTHLGSLGRTGNMLQFQGGIRELAEVSKRVLDKTGVKASDIRAFFGTNAGVNHLKLMAQAARVPLDRVFYDDVPRNGHLHSCDGLISLKNYSMQHELTSGDLFMLLSWSPHVFCASLLRFCELTQY